MDKRDRIPRLHPRIGLGVVGNPRAGAECQDKARWLACHWQGRKPAPLFEINRVLHAHGAVILRIRIKPVRAELDQPIGYLCLRAENHISREILVRRDREARHGAVRHGQLCRDDNAILALRAGPDEINNRVVRVVIDDTADPLAKMAHPDRRAADRRNAIERRAALPANPHLPPPAVPPQIKHTPRSPVPPKTPPPPPPPRWRPLTAGPPTVETPPSHAPPCLRNNITRPPPYRARGHDPPHWLARPSRSSRPPLRRAGGRLLRACRV